VAALGQGWTQYIASLKGVSTAMVKSFTDLLLLDLKLCPTAALIEEGHNTSSKWLPSGPTLEIQSGR
jgi:hypothetical protein